MYVKLNTGNTSVRSSGIDMEVGNTGTSPPPAQQRTSVHNDCIVIA